MLKKLMVVAAALAVIAAGADAQDAPGAVPQSSGSFGGIFGPNYTRPDPNASPLDQAADLLKQRIKRANEIATNPVAQIFAPEQVQAARDFVPKATGQLQAIEKQKADIAAGRRQAEIMGIGPGEISDQATSEDRIAFAQARALKGDLRAFQGLQAVSSKDAEAIQDQVHSALSANLANAQTSFDKLSNARGQGEYAATLRELRQSGAIAGLESVGLKVPDSFQAFSATKGREAEALRKARIAVDAIGQKLERRNTYQGLNNAGPVKQQKRSATAGNCDSPEMRNNVAGIFTGGTANHEVLQVAAEGTFDDCRVYIVSVGDLSDPDRGNRKPLRVPVLQAMNLQLRSDGAYEIKGDEAIVWAFGVDFSEVEHSEDHDLRNCDSPVIGERIIAASDTAAANSINAFRGSKAMGRIMQLHGASADKAGPHLTVIACSFFVPREYEQDGKIHAMVHEILVRSFSNGRMNLNWRYVPFDIVRYLYPPTLEHKRWFAGLAQDSTPARGR